MAMMHNNALKLTIHTNTQPCMNKLLSKYAGSMALTYVLKCDTTVYIYIYIYIYICTWHRFHVCATLSIFSHTHTSANFKSLR